jgi:two-component system, chemotaxis family, protein-glutamate methylesterase/glutaminase
LQKIRAAATAKPKISVRLRERVLHRTRGRQRREANAGDSNGRKARASGHGLVLVGTSTGGPPALEALLVPLPVHFPWPILVAQHMPATFTGPLAQRLDKLCALTVVEVLRPSPLRAGHVYIGRGDADLIVTKRASGLVAMSAPAEADYPWHPSTNRLVQSALANVEPEQLIGVLMTGMGDDGVEAMTQLWQRGGTTIAESEKSAVVWGMPGELVRAGSADWIEPVHKIAARLQLLTPKNAPRS